MTSTARITTEITPRVRARKWLVLGVLALGALITSIDGSVVLLALPRIASGVRANSAEQLWILDVYGFFLAGLLVPFGSLADRLGRRRMLMLGAAAFGAASLVAALTTTPTVMILARAVCGVAAAALTPAMFGILSATFRGDRQRSAAIGIFMACFMGGMVVGPIVGGVVLSSFPWPAVFLMTVPVMVLLLAACPLLVPAPTSENSKSSRIDWLSVPLSLVAVLAFVYGLTEVARTGISWASALATTLGLATGVVFVLRQRRLGRHPDRQPLVDLSMFRTRGFAVVTMSLMLMTMLTGPLMMLNTQYFQLVAGLGPLRAGFLTVPAALVSVGAFILVPRLGRFVPPGVLISAGLALIVAALVLIAQITPQSGPWPLVIGFALVSLGAAPLPTLGTNLIIGSVAPEKASSAASLSEMSGQLGYALGIALLGSIVTLVYRMRFLGSSGLTRDQQATASDSIAGVQPVARAVSPHVASVLQQNAAAAFCSGIQAAALTAAVVMAILACVCFLRLRHLTAFQK